ncbi:MAG: ABC transporter ATP-binding protein [Desulfobacula sp.]|nr:ABC transporter ATP-binding protein [Desulfobacula sp.]
MIQIENLTKYYKDFCAVDKINLNISKGEILGLLGPNGAGKTTILRMLTGYFKPDSGTIKVKNFQMPDDTLKIKSLIGYLPESAPLYHNMLVYDYLDYVAKLRGMNDKQKRYDRFLQLSELCGLSSIMARPIGNLSKGLKQRVGIAHAMLTDPEILVLDEPTSGLDPNQIAEIRNIIRTIGKEKTIIFSTHILSEAEATCDRIAIINKGRVVADDTTSNLKQSVKQDSYIKLSLRGTSGEDAYILLDKISPDITVQQTEPSEKDAISFEIKSKENQDIRSLIYMKIKKTDWIICEFKKQSQDLEKIFQTLTREQN